MEKAVDSALNLYKLVQGEGDFEKSIAIALNCGEDTDCTCATMGAVYGILFGAKNIPEK